jgi:hypothetical protein
VATLIPNQRHLFDIPDDVAFFNWAYMSPLPKASVALGERGLARKARPWTITPDDFFTASEAVRARFACLINAAPNDVAFAPAVSYGMAQAAANITLEPRCVIDGTTCSRTIRCSSSFPRPIPASR